MTNIKKQTTIPLKNLIFLLPFNDFCNFFVVT